MDEIINIVIKILAALLALGAGYLGRYLLRIIKAKLDEKTTEKLDLFITELVSASEQMYKNDDPDGTVRLGYVQKMLIESGYELTDAVKALIESKVFNINMVQKGL